MSLDRREFLIHSSALLATSMSASALSPSSSKPRAGDSFLTNLSAVAAVAAMRSGDLRAEDYAAALLQRATRLADLNAFLTVKPEQIKEAARNADKSRAAGRTLGLLHGLPIPVKDSINTKDLPTSNGTRALRDFVPQENAEVLKSLFKQGAILMGKTNLHELSWGWTSNNQTFGAVRNPYDRSRTPGGSSGGSATAVAARIAPLAVAEDTYGSIRVPAAFCGVAGLRPSFNRYPDDGILTLTRAKFDQVGPLARSVEDLILFDTVVAGDRAPVTPVPLQGVRIGVSPAFLSEGLDPDSERLTDEAVRKLRHAGVQVVVAELPEPLRQASKVVSSLIFYEALDNFAMFLKEESTGVTLDELISQAGANIEFLLAAARKPGSHQAYLSLVHQREAIKLAAAEYFRAYEIEALVFPPVLTPAFPQGDSPAVRVGDRDVDLLDAIGRNMGLGSCASLSCLVLPIGLTRSGLPVALEFDAPSGSDRRLLALGLSLEKALGPIQPPALDA
jgi:indoleacetamide hydrolase